jgi:hypothetical protein
VEDDGSTKIDGETGITTNAQGQTTNIGGSAGITIGNPTPAKAEGAAPVRLPTSDHLHLSIPGFSPRLRVSDPTLEFFTLGKEMD